MTEIKQCTCKHAQQDQMYGTNQRLHNAMIAKGKIVGYRCTICHDKKLVSQPTQNK